MRLVGILGLLTLLGIAWAMSYHHRSVRLRPIVWGLGLQFLFAVIILRKDSWSYVGMVLLAGLIVAYVAQGFAPRRGWAGVAVALVVAAAGGAVLTLTAPAALPWLLAAAVVVVVVGGRLRLPAVAVRSAGVLVVVAATALLISRGLYGQKIFAALSERVAAFLALSDYGARFLFGNLADPSYFFTEAGAMWPGFGFQFAFKVLPTILFFGGFMGVLYHLGVMQKVVESMARFMRWTIGTSGAETLSCSANIFVGQTEAPLLIRPFLDDLTPSELLTVMVGGFATIAGGVLAGYVAMGIPAGHLIAASVMAAPGALMVGKIIYPERAHSATAGDVKMPDVDAGGNVIEAATNGILDGLKLAVNVGAMLLGFIALIAVIDVLLSFCDGLIDGRLLGGTWVAYHASGMSPATGEFLGWFPGSLQTVFGTLLRPVAWLMGVPWSDSAAVGNLLGIKISLNEFIAYGTLSNYIQAGALSERAAVISTYALCGFANFSSIGIQIGGISAVAPSRKSELARLGLKAMFGGALTSCLTATLAGLLM